MLAHDGTNDPGRTMTLMFQEDKTDVAKCPELRLTTDDQRPTTIFGFELHLSYLDEVK
jgi:hypothetical protein